MRRHAAAPAVAPTPLARPVVAPVLEREGPPPPLELTARALLVGCAIGAVLAIGNLYMGLKTGWWESGTITSSVLAFSLVSALGRGRGAPYTPLENNLTQTTAAAVGAMPAAAGLLGAIPALAMLGQDAPGWGIAAWGAALGVLGVLMAASLRRRLLAEERLPFPTGIATAEVISALHTPGKALPGRPRTLLTAGALSMLFTWLRDAPPRWLPALTAAPGRLAGAPASTFTLGISWSPMLLAIGALVGPLVGLSVLLGAVLAWGVLAPVLVHAGVATLEGEGGFAAWLAWPGVGLMVGSGMGSLLGYVRALPGTARDLRALGQGGVLRGRRREILGLGLACAALTVGLGWALFGLPPHHTGLVLLLLFPLTSVCARAAGQTDISPVSQMGQLTQVAAGMAGVHGPASNVAASAVVTSAAAQAGVGMWALKAGQLLGASPRRQVVGQLVGVLVGAGVGVPVYFLLVRTYGLGTEALPAPSAVQSRALAEVATRGLSGLPPYATAASLVAFALGVALTLAARGRLARFVPSAAAMGIGFIAPAHYGVAIALGSLLSAAARARWPRWAQAHLPALGAGAIAGESVMGVLIAALVAAGALASS